MNSMESKNFWISIMAGVFATLLLYSSFNERIKEYDKRFAATESVLVARKDINEMQSIFENMVEVKNIPKEFVSVDALRSMNDLGNQVAAIPIKAGQQLTKNMLLLPGTDTGIAMQISAGNRAITIPIDEVRGIAKLIRPGDRIDVVASVDVGKGSNQRRESKYLMQAKTVIATGVSILNNIPRISELDANGRSLTQTSLVGDSKYSTITIEVNPKEAQDLTYLLSTSPGNIFLLLRNPNDREVKPQMASSTAESVLGNALMPVADSQPAPMIPAFASPTAPQPQPRAPAQAPNRNGFRRL
ncbi:MAG: Flp pilus assembly protein CpaB [Pseudobdellovibrionaceae bacterium]